MVQPLWMSALAAISQGITLPSLVTRTRFALSSNLVINVVLFRRMWSDNDRMVRKCTFQGRDKFLEILEYGQLVIPKSFGELSGHAPGGTPEAGFLAGGLSGVKTDPGPGKRHLHD